MMAAAGRECRGLVSGGVTVPHRQSCPGLHSTSLSRRDPHHHPPPSARHSPRSHTNSAHHRSSLPSPLTQRTTLPSHTNSIHHLPPFLFSNSASHLSSFPYHCLTTPPSSLCPSPFSLPPHHHHHVLHFTSSQLTGKRSVSLRFVFSPISDPRISSLDGAFEDVVSVSPLGDI